MVDEEQVAIQLKRLNDLWDEMVETRQSYGELDDPEKLKELQEKLTKLNQNFVICWRTLDAIGHFPFAKVGGGFY